MKHSLEIIRPNDFHCHFRQGDLVSPLAKISAQQFGYVTVMPNTVPPITSVRQARSYQYELQAATNYQPHFKPMMTLYLTDQTNHDEIKLAKDKDWIIGAKLYPCGATTNSQSGVTDTMRYGYPIFAHMEKVGLPLLVHGELVDPSVDIFDREPYFIVSELTDILNNFPRLKVVLEHITTRRAVDFIKLCYANQIAENPQSRPRLVATITAHHLLINRNAIFGVGEAHPGLCPHNYCLPVAKLEDDRIALIEAATNTVAPLFFAGTDSAPHDVKRKEAACCAAGCFTSMHAIELYTMAFEQANRLDNLEKFVSLNGKAFFNLPTNQDRVIIDRVPQTIPKEVKIGSTCVVPFMAGKEIPWTFKGAAT